MRKLNRTIIILIDHCASFPSPIDSIEEVLSPQINNDSETDQDNDDADLLYTNESLLPQVDWDNLEKQLKQAQIERERYDKVRTFSKQRSDVVLVTLSALNDCY